MGLPLPLLIGTPIGLALAASGMVGSFLTRRWVPLDFLIGTFSCSHTAKLACIVLPLVRFMGHMTFVSGLSYRAFTVAQRLIGIVSGGLAMATAAASAAFGRVCGSSVAVASTMAKIANPEVLKRGDAPQRAAVVVAAGVTLGMWIPPSNIRVVYSIATQTSLVDLFLAAIGALVATLLLRQKQGGRQRMIREGLVSTGTATSSSLLSIIGAGLFSMALATTQIPAHLADWAVHCSQHRDLARLLILVPLFVLGMFVDGISMLLLTRPIVLTVINRLGFDPIWLASGSTRPSRSAYRHRPWA